MSFDEFKEMLEQEIKKYFPKGITVNFKKVAVNNGGLLEGVEINDGSKKIIPVFDAEEMFESVQAKKETIPSAVEDMIRQYNQVENISEADYAVESLEDVKNNICFRVINYEKNKEMLKDIPYKIWNDLAVVLHICLFYDEDYISVKVTNDQMEDWNVQKEFLFELACVNTPRIYPIMIKAMPDEITNIPVYMMSNSKLLFGAGCMLYQNSLKELADAIKDDLFIIPSSVNEVLLLPAKGNEEKSEELRRTVTAETESGEVFLSEAVYRYSRKNDKTELV